MIADIQQLEKDALAVLGKAVSEDALLAVRTKYLGRKGLLTGMLRNISQVPADEKPLFGKRCNEIKNLLGIEPVQPPSMEGLARREGEAISMPGNYTSFKKYLLSRLKIS